MKEIVNLTSRPVVLENGMVIAAAGTDGSVKRIESLSDADAQRLGGSIALRDAEVEQPASSSRKSLAGDESQKK